MKIPTVTGIIDRRMLINFTADKNIVTALLPAPFRPRLYKEKAIVGICLIRLRQIRPKWLPAFVGLSSENGAHRIAVEWTENGIIREGVYIPRRDTSSRLNTWLGGRLFPGKPYHAQFSVVENNTRYRVAFESTDGTSISVDAERSDGLPRDSVFDNLHAASLFFEKGTDGYSANGGKLEGLRLKTKDWKVEALQVSSVHSSFFFNKLVFPEGSVAFDHALLMTHVSHEWEDIGPMHSS